MKHEIELRIRVVYESEDSNESGNTDSTEFAAQAEAQAEELERNLEQAIGNGILTGPTHELLVDSHEIGRLEVSRNPVNQ